MTTCSRKHCGEEAIGTTPHGDPLCLDHMGEWLDERDCCEADQFDERGRKARVMRHGRAW